MNRRHLLAFGCTTLTVVSLAATSLAAAVTVPRVGEVAPDFTLNDLEGKAVQLSQATSKSNVVLVVLRGFPGYQCPVCTVQVRGLLAKAEELRALGARVILIYPGPANDLTTRAREFVAKQQLPAGFTLLTDPDYRFTSAYGLRWNAAGETAYPSTLVIDKDRRVRFTKVSQTHGGRATTDAILAALKAMEP